MLGDGIIEPGEGAWAAPVVLAKKKDGSWRFCVDYRRLNEQTVRMSNPMQNVEAVLTSLGGNDLYTTLDLASGYWAIPLDEQTKDKTGFITPEGLFQYKRLPFGLTNAPAAFTQMMEMVLAGLTWKYCGLYMDDCIVYSDGVDEHFHRLRVILSRFRDANLRCKLKKCCFFMKEVEYLGHIITAEGVRMSPDKIKAIVELPAPSDVKGVQRIVGMAGFYRKFIKNFSKRIFIPVL